MEPRRKTWRTYGQESDSGVSHAYHLLPRPMQSWGSRASFNVRPTDLYPTKRWCWHCCRLVRHPAPRDEKLHALHALILPCGWIARRTLAGLSHGLSKGRTERDDRAWVTERYYLEDAVFVVTLSHKDPAFIESIYWGCAILIQPFMGRCALLPFRLWGWRRPIPSNSTETLGDE